MKVIVAGSRHIDSVAAVNAAILGSGFKITELVSGRCEGVDQTAEALARLHGLPVKEFPANWSKHGKAAGPIRNREMAEYADALIAIWDGESRGTKNMIETMEKLKKQVFVMVKKNHEATE